MATTVARLSSNGVYFTNTYFDEVTTTYIPITTGSVNFNGSSYLSVTDNSNLPSNSTAYTIEAFINIPDGATVGNWGICGWGDWGSYGKVTAFRTNGPSTLVTYWWGNDVIVSTIPLNDGKWHHIVTQFDGVSRTVFVDGISLGGDVAFDHTVTRYDNFKIGSTNNSEYFNGKISNLRIVSGLAVYSGDFRVPNKPLRAVQGASTNIASIAAGQTVLLLNTGTDNPFKDSSSYNYTVNNTNTTSLSDAPFPTLVPENLNKIGLSAMYSSCFDEVTIQGIGGGIAKRETDDGSVLVSGYFDEVTGIPVVAPSLIGSTASTHSPTLFGSITLSATSAFSGGESSYNLNGTSQYLTIPASTDWVMGTGDFTVEWFQYMRTQPSHPRVFSIGTYPTAAWAVSIEGGTFYHWEANGYRFSNSLTAGGYLNQWIHFAICRIGGTTKVYKNGTLIGASYVDTYNINNSSTVLTISQESSPNTGSYFDGFITSFRICKGLGVYTGNFTKPTSKLGQTQSANPYGGSNTSAINAGSCVLLLNP